MPHTLTTSEFLARLQGEKIKITPKISIDLEDGGSIVIEADCSGCNNSKQPVVYAAGESYPKRWNCDGSSEA